MAVTPIMALHVVARLVLPSTALRRPSAPDVMGSAAEME
jgi:hypothetical protein